MLTNEDYAKAFHEIKNSITIVNSSLQLLEKQHPEVTDFEYWEDSRDALNYLREMVRELSQAKLASDFPMQPVNLNILLDNVLASIRNLRFSNGFQCKNHIDDGLPLIMADSCRLTQAIINLVKNAYEAMDETGTIIFKAYQEGCSVHIDIVDFGGGINPEYQKQMFTPFFTSKPNGTGLGLAITKQIVESHHGFLNYASREGDGCTFSIILPLMAK